VRRLVLTLALLSLSACGVSLRTHALVAATSGEVIDSVGAALESESRGDYEDVIARYEGDERAHQVEMLKQTYEPLRVDYRQVKDAWSLYLKAIGMAAARDDASLVEHPARVLFGMWSTLQDVADRLGVKTPNPPDALRKMAGGDT
jgi:hypothetical protein